ncbi:MAG TPA: anti-sigma factor [Candidatus Binataceae bacterium]|nr:anti-sigma factor [Candidatus Binataceae bacterium]
MDHTHPEPAALAASASPEAPPSDSRRSALWRAVAGMAAALALAAAIVAVDLSHELVERITHYRSRIASLNRSVDALKRQRVADEKQLADAREEIRAREFTASRDRIKAIMLAPDRKTIRLLAASSDVPASGAATVSAKMDGGVLNVRGLPALRERQTYAAWWMLKDAPPAKAAEFRSTADGSASEYLDAPPRGAVPLSIAVTLEPTPGGATPGGSIKLRGKVPPVMGEEASGGAAKH